MIVTLNVTNAAMAKSAQRELADAVSAVVKDAFGSDIEEGDREQIVAAVDADPARVAGHPAVLRKMVVGALYSYDVTIDVR